MIDGEETAAMVYNRQPIVDLITQDRRERDRRNDGRRRPRAKVLLPAPEGRPF
jgi:hypothetical protein